MKSVWLINLFGIPYAPSSFNPDNSLASIAGSLKAANYKPRIFDYQTTSFCSELMPKEIGHRLYELIENIGSNTPTQVEIDEIAKLDQLILKHQFNILDGVGAHLVNKAKDEKPLFIGFKLYSGDGNQLSRYLARYLKKHINIPFVGGGPLIRVIGKHYFELYNEFDYILDGECDNSIVQLAEFLAKKEKIQNVRGLTYISNSKIIQNPLDNILDLNILPDPCYDEDVYPALYKQNQKSFVFQLDESRGCPNKCNFCVHPHINDHSFRINSPKKMIRQIKELQEKFGAYAFRFTGSNTPKKFLKGFAEQVIKEKLEIKYSCYASVNTTTPEILHELKESGLVGIFIGAESVDKKTLKEVFNKTGQTNEKLTQLIQSCFKNDIYITTSWIYPMPGFSNEIKHQLVDYISEQYGTKSLDRGSVMLVPSGLMPNTEWFFNKEKYGFKINNMIEYLKSYADLNLRFWLPRSLMRPWQFQLEGLTFHELSKECDVLSNELTKRNAPLGITDDWMLQGKLSGHNMHMFKKTTTKALLRGDQEVLEKTIRTINNHSVDRLW